MNKLPPAAYIAIQAMYVALLLSVPVAAGEPSFIARYSPAKSPDFEQVNRELHISFG